VPSSGYAGSGRAPASSRKVAVQSGEKFGSWLTWSPSMRCGQRTIVGTRMPPSWSTNFSPLNGQRYDQRSPPLSLAKYTSVFSSCPDRRSAASTSPTAASRLCTISVYFATEPPSYWLRASLISNWLVAARIFAAISAPVSSSPSASQGQCGVVKLRFSSHGLSCSRPTYSTARSVSTCV
jgi:hypothetical protein